MHGGHTHGPAPAELRGGTAAIRHKKRLVIALTMTLTYMLAEVVGAIVTGSLALLADAAHMLTDAGGLALALVAINLSARKPTLTKSFGYHRAEILAALINAVILLAVSAYILWEAYQRFLSPPEVLGWPMLLVATVGLVVNLVSMKILAVGAEESLNLKGAYFEVLSDMLGSVGVIVAALLVMFTGWTLADPLIGAGIGLFIVPRTLRFLNQTVHILLEGTPENIDLERLRQDLASVPNVKDVTDLHVWTITSGLDAMSCHLLVQNMQVAPDVLRQCRAVAAERYKIGHVTIQIEDEQLRAEAPSLVV